MRNDALYDFYWLHRNRYILTFQTKGFVVWSICSIFFLYEFFLRTVLGAYQQSIMIDLSLSAFDFSLLSTTIFLITYATMQIPAGIIVDNIGLKKSLLFGVSICIISSLGFSLSDTYLTALLFRFILGVGASFGFICLLVCVYEWMPRQYLAIFMGLSQFIGTLGPMAGAGPIEHISSEYNLTWQELFFAMSVLGVILMILVGCFVENNRSKQGNYTVLYKPEAISKVLRHLFKRSQPWLIAITSASLYFSLEYLSENEGRTLLGLKGISPNTAGYMITLSWVGYAFGCPLFGFFSDFFQRRVSTLKITSFMTLAALLMFLHLSSPTMLFVSFFLLGLGASGQNIGFALMSEQFKKQYLAIGLGLNNTMITIFAGINAPLIGLLIDNYKSGPKPTISEYTDIFYIMVITIAIGFFIALFFIKETYCKSVAEFTILKRKSD